MPSEEQVLSPDSPPFNIRQFVSTIRGQDFSRCWPFSQRILERCILLGMNVELPPLDSPLKGCIFGSHDNSPDISFNDCSMKAESCGFSNGSHIRADSKETAESSRRLADSQQLFSCGADAVNLAENNAFFSSQSCLLFSQSPDESAVVKPSTESFWDDNAISLDTGDTSISGSQMLMQGKAELPDHAIVNLTGKSGVLHVARDNMAVIEEPNYDLFQVTKEEGFAALTKPSIELHNTCTVLPSQGVLVKIHPSANHGKDLADIKSPKMAFKPAQQLSKFDTNGFIPKTEKTKHAIDPGLHKSNSDASMPQVCPVCSKFSSGSNTTLNAHIDHCLVLDEADERPSKKRLKIRKLRSMVDIYATAPTCTLEDLERGSQAWSFRKV